MVSLLDDFSKVVTVDPSCFHHLIWFSKDQKRGVNIIKIYFFRQLTIFLSSGLSHVSESPVEIPTCVILGSEEIRKFSEVEAAKTRNQKLKIPSNCLISISSNFQFEDRNWAKYDFLTIRILYEMTFWRSEFCMKWPFDDRNFAWKDFLTVEFCMKLIFDDQNLAKTDFLTIGI